MLTFKGGYRVLEVCSFLPLGFNRGTSVAPFSRYTYLHYCACVTTPIPSQETFDAGFCQRQTERGLYPHMHHSRCQDYARHRVRAWALSFVDYSACRSETDTYYSWLPWTKGPSPPYWSSSLRLWRRFPSETDSLDNHTLSFLLLLEAVNSSKLCILCVVWSRKGQLMNLEPWTHDTNVWCATRIWVPVPAL